MGAAPRVLVSGVIGATASGLGCAAAFLATPCSLDELDAAVARAQVRAWRGGRRRDRCPKRAAPLVR